MLFPRQKIGLALGGGGPKGLAHIGVIKTLEKYHIPIDYIAGTSAGSLIGGFYALTKDIASVEQYILNKNWVQMLSYFSDPSIINGGFLHGNRVERFLNGYIHNALIESTRIPFTAVAVDLKTAQKIELKKGSLAQAVRASCSIPMVFKPVEMDPYVLVDGAVLSSVPVETVKKMGADIIIAVQLNNEYVQKDNIEKANIIQIGDMSFSIMARKIAQTEVKNADILVKPDVSSVHWKSLLKQEGKVKGIESGIRAMEAVMLQLRIQMQKNKVQRFFSKIASSFRL